MLDFLSSKVTDAFRHIRGKSKISEKNIEDTLANLRESLLAADVHFKVVKQFLTRVKDAALGAKVIQGVNPGEQFVKIVHDELTHLLGGKESLIDWHKKGLCLLVVGLNGAGKTTFAAKLALYLKEKLQKKVLLVSLDTYRPKAMEQLSILGKQISTETFIKPEEKSPLKIIPEALAESRRMDADIIIFDSAGRLNVDETLMEEIVTTKKLLPHVETLLVVDAMTGQEALNVTKSFHQNLNLTGVVLSKMDSDARGGAALSLREITGVPICFISQGEKLKDLDIFYPERLAGRILDMGDVLTLVEKAQEVVDEKESANMMERMTLGKLTFNDFLRQMEMLSQMGSMDFLLKMIPGMGNLTKRIGDMTGAQEEMKKFKYIIQSMTKVEKETPSLFQEVSRKRRIAQGAGVQLSEVELFLTRFQQMQKMMGGLLPQMQKQKVSKTIPSVKDVKPKGPWGKNFFKST